MTYTTIIDQLVEQYCRDHGVAWVDLPVSVASDLIRQAREYFGQQNG